MQLCKYSRANEIAPILKSCRGFFSLSFLYDEPKIVHEQDVFQIEERTLYIHPLWKLLGQQYHCLGHVKG